MKRGVFALAAVVAALLPAAARAAGGGAGAGGAGHQRAINSGLPPGEPGPLGSPNNPRRDEPGGTIAREVPAARSRSR